VAEGGSAWREAAHAGGEGRHNRSRSERLPGQAAAGLTGDVVGRLGVQHTGVKLAGDHLRKGSAKTSAGGGGTARSLSTTSQPTKHRRAGGKHHASAAVLHMCCTGLGVCRRLTRLVEVPMMVLVPPSSAAKESGMSSCFSSILALAVQVSTMGSRMHTTAGERRRAGGGVCVCWGGWVGGGGGSQGVGGGTAWVGEPQPSSLQWLQEGVQAKAMQR
jgi:hypothetical protein